MEISATVVNQDGRPKSMVRTGDKAQSLAIPAKAAGFGAAVNGGELLFLARLPPAIAMTSTAKQRHEE
jgi:hypothetical protein